jgi:hypothetical protein
LTKRRKKRKKWEQEKNEHEEQIIRIRNGRTNKQKRTRRIGRDEANREGK